MYDVIFYWIKTTFSKIFGRKIFRKFKTCRVKGITFQDNSSFHDIQDKKTSIISKTGGNPVASLSQSGHITAFINELMKATRYDILFFSVFDISLDTKYQDDL